MGILKIHGAQKDLCKNEMVTYAKWINTSVQLQ